jgi:hypothetical protein
MAMCLSMSVGVRVIPRVPQWRPLDRHRDALWWRLAALTPWCLRRHSAAVAVPAGVAEDDEALMDQRRSRCRVVSHCRRRGRCRVEMIR